MHPRVASPEDTPPIRGLRTVAGDLASVTAARALSLCFSAGVVILTARLLTPGEYAILAYLTVVSTLIFTICSAWTAAALSRYGREELEERGDLRGASWDRLALTAPLLLLASGATVVLAAVGAFPHEFTWRFVWIALATGALLTWSDHCVVALEAAGRMRVSAVALAARGALLVAVLGALVWRSAHVSPYDVALIALAASAVVAVGIVAPNWRTALWPPRLDRVLMRRMLAFALPLVAFVVSQYGMRAVDIVVLRAFRPAADVGVYAVAYQAYTMLTQVGTTASIVLTPLFVSVQGAGRADVLLVYLRRLVPQFALAASIVVGIATPLIGVVVPVLFGSRFSAAADPLRVLFGALVLQAVASLVAPILVLYERSKGIALVNLAAMALNLLGDIVLVGPLGVGIVGPAIATVGAVAVIASGYLWLAGRALGVPASVTPWPLLPLALGLVAALLLSGAVAIACALGTIALVTGAVIRWTGVVRRDDAEVVRRLGLPPPVQGAALRVVGFAAR